jgi:hypothetical protein
MSMPEADASREENSLVCRELVNDCINVSVGEVGWFGHVVLGDTECYPRRAGDR